MVASPELFFEVLVFNARAAAGFEGGDGVVHEPALRFHEERHEQEARPVEAVVAVHGEQRVGRGRTFGPVSIRGVHEARHSLA